MSETRPKRTSICAFPFGIGGIPVSSNEPSSRLSFVSLRSPSNTLFITAAWLSSAVVYTFERLVGITVFRGMISPISPPVVSIPSVSGVTSRRRRSLVDLSRSPLSTPACTAAPYATASSGLIDLFGSFPLKYSVNSCCTLGIRVEPPTRTTSSTSPSRL